MEHTKEPTNTNTTKGWLQKGGIVVFVFFLLKGIGWLVLLAAVAMGLMNEEAVQKLKDAIPFF